MSSWRTAGPPGAAAADGATRPPGPSPAAGADLAPGDLLTLPELRDFACEWAVVERDGGGSPPRLLLVPADTHPACGSADVRIAARDPLGPLTLRCAFAAWLPQAFLGNARRGGSLGAADLERASRRIAALASRAGGTSGTGRAGDTGLGGRRGHDTDKSRDGDMSPAIDAGHAADGAAGRHAGSALDRETDDDPEYRDWIAETVAPAARALSAARARWEAAAAVAMARGGAPARRQSPLLLRLAAAALLVVSVGTTWKAISLHHQVDLLSQPVSDAPSAELPLDGPHRGPDHLVKLSVPRGAPTLLLNFDLDPEPPTAGGRIKILDAAGAVVWTSPPIDPRSPSHNLLVPHALLPDGRYRIVFYPRGGEAKEPSAACDLELSTTP